MKDKGDQKELTWSTVDLDDKDDVARFEKLELQRAGERIKKAVEKLHNHGIIDEQGELINPELPPDMEPGWCFRNQVLGAGA